MSYFSEKIYQVVKSIPKGSVLTYKQVAKKAGFPRAWRAVGNVLNKNKDARIPCHRVVCSNGEAGGYNQGQREKIRKLKKEGIAFLTKTKIRL